MWRPPRTAAPHYRLTKPGGRGRATGSAREATVPHLLVWSPKHLLLCSLAAPHNLEPDSVRFSQRLSDTFGEISICHPVSELASVSALLSWVQKMWEESDDCAGLMRFFGDASVFAGSVWTWISSRRSPTKAFWWAKRCSSWTMRRSGLESSSRTCSPTPAAPLRMSDTKSAWTSTRWSAPVRSKKGKNVRICVR